jgi:CubicO group peptidase (beta-lactamase class C family)
VYYKDDMRKSVLKLIMTLFLTSNSMLLIGQVAKKELLLKKPIVTEIGSKEIHEYQIMMSENQFAFFKLEQIGTDLTITTLNPKGKKINDFDSPNGRAGFELFSITSTTKGLYTVKIKPFDKNEPIGTYSLSLHKIKPKASSLNEQVDELFTLYDNDNTPGAAVAIIKDGAVVYKNGYGLANLEYDIPITTSGVFNIASVSKQFTVFSILLLEKEGKLSLDDDIRKYIPEMPDFGKTITLRHLASHTSGLRSIFSLLVMAGWRLDDVITLEHALKFTNQQKELNNAPGDELIYSNTGFILLAEVVARVSKKSFTAYTKENIFEPLGMHHSFFYDDHEKIVKNRVYSYHTDSQRYKNAIWNFSTVGNGGLYTTVEDLSLWALNFSNLKIGSKDIIEKMNTPTVLNNGDTTDGALGQFISSYKGLKEIHHDGGSAGFRTYLCRFPDQKFNVIVLSNDESCDPYKLAHQIVDIYLKDKIEPKKKESKKEDTTEVINIEQDVLATYIGNFELEPKFTLTIINEDGNLSVKATGEDELSLTALTTTEFKVKDDEAKIEFIPNEGKNVKLIKLHQDGQVYEATRIKEFDKTAVNLSEFSGDFYSEELLTTIKIKVVDNKLIICQKRLDDKILTMANSKDIFKGEYWFPFEMKFLRDENKQITGYKISSDRARNILFEKKAQYTTKPKLH